MFFKTGTKAVVSLSLFQAAIGVLIANESATYLFLANDRLVTSLNKSTGAIETLTLDGENLLGTKDIHAKGRAGTGPHLDCYCTPEGAYTPGSDPSHEATYKLYQGTDSSNVTYGGVSLSQIYMPTGQVLEQYWFLRDGETGLHGFSRFAYYNETTPNAGVLQELRTLLRPNTSLWTHLITDEVLYAPLPKPDPATGNLTDAYQVQDTTWYIGNRTDDPYVEEFADYFTKYTFSNAYRDQKVHGLFGDGSQSSDGSAFGAWLVMNTKDTYFGGPTHSDLVVDGIVYNYIISNHHGDQAPNITNGFDRTFGPSYYYFNKGPPSTTWQTLRNQALEYATPSWNADFYDDIAHLIPNYVSSSDRGSWKAEISIPSEGKNPIAVLSLNGVDFQDNRDDAKAYQYWADIDATDGSVEIDRIKPGIYRLTVYADGIFGDFIQEDIVIKAGNMTDSGSVTWIPESSGTELWRIGTPDKSSGEYLHGNAPYPSSLHPPQYRIYWGAYDYLSDFPQGVNFRIPTSDPSKDFNYIHWSVFGGQQIEKLNTSVIVPDAGNGNINNWTVNFDIGEDEVKEAMEVATLTIQLAGAQGASGNTDVWNPESRWNDVPYVVVVNGHQLETWVIPYDKSSSCGARSSVSCYQLSNKWTFPTSYLVKGGNTNTSNGTAATNEIVLSLPFDAQAIYVQYDALRLEVR